MKKTKPDVYQYSNKEGNEPKPYSGGCVKKPATNNRAHISKVANE